MLGQQTIDREALEKRLKSLVEKNRQGVVEFAARVALRVFPLIADKSSDFSVFKKTPEKHALAVWRACWLSYSLSIGKKSKVAADAAYAAYADAYADDAAYAAADAAYAARAARAARAATHYNPGFMTSLEHDLEQLEQGYSLQSKPLWLNPDQALDTKGLKQACEQADNALALSDADVCFATILHDYDAIVRGDLDYLNTQRTDKYDALWERVKSVPDIASVQALPTKTESPSKSSKPLHYQPGQYFSDDGVADQDHLNRDQLVHALSQWLTASANREHLTLGLFGDWGAGKSTVVKFLQQRLENAEAVEFVFAEFKAWEYEHCGHMHAGLAQEVVEGLTQGLSGWQRLSLTVRYAWREHRTRLKLLGAGAITLVTTNVLLALFAEALSLTDAFSFEYLLPAQLVAAVAVGWSSLRRVLSHPLAKEWYTYLRLPKFGEYLGEIPVLQQQIKALVALRLDNDTDIDQDKKAKNESGWWHRLFKTTATAGNLTTQPATARRLLFVVDDLDRCSPEAVVETLEAVRLVMDLPNVVVLIAIDPKIAVASLAVRHQSIERYMGAGAEHVARNYLGKILQASVVLERPNTDDVQGFLQQLWQRDGNSDSSSDDEKGQKTEKRGVQPAGQDIDSQDADLARETGHGGVSNSNTDSNTDSNEGINANDSTGKNHSPNHVANTAASNAQVIPDVQNALSPVQKRLFSYWVEAFNFHNPRQLKRLNNAYALLRHCYPDEDGHYDDEAFESLLTKDDVVALSKHHPRLVFLLWLEYVEALPVAAERQQLLQALHDEHGSNVADSHKALWAQVNGIVPLDQRQKVASQVRCFILPALAEKPVDGGAKATGT